MDLVSTGGQEVPKRHYQYHDDGGDGKAVYLVVDAMEWDIIQKINRDYGIRSKNKRTGRPEWNIEEAANGEATKHMARLVWRDCVNLHVRLKNQAAIDLYNKELKVEHELGARVRLDGKLTDEIKKDLLSTNLPLAGWIVGKANDPDADAVSEEEVLRKNS